MVRTVACAQFVATCQNVSQCLSRVIPRQFQFQVALPPIVNTFDWLSVVLQLSGIHCCDLHLQVLGSCCGVWEERSADCFYSNTCAARASRECARPTLGATCAHCWITCSAPLHCCFSLLFAQLSIPQCTSPAYLSPVTAFHFHVSIFILQCLNWAACSVLLLSFVNCHRVCVCIAQTRFFQRQSTLVAIFDTF